MGKKDKRAEEIFKVILMGWWGDLKSTYPKEAAMVKRVFLEKVGS